MRWTVGMLRSESRVCVVTLAPASLQTRAAARSPKAEYVCRPNRRSIGVEPTGGTTWIPIKQTYRRTFADPQRDLGQNPWDGPAIMDYQPWSFESLRPCELGITLASGGWPWRITTPGLDPPNFIFSTMWKNFGWDLWKTASSSTSQLACDKGVFSPHICFVQYLSGHCPSGGRNAMVLATTFRTEEFPYWICDLLTLIFFGKSYEEIGQVLDVGGCPPTSWCCPQRWENEDFKDAEPTSSKTCISKRDSCGNPGARPCSQMVGLYDKHSHKWQPRTWSRTPSPCCI